MTSARSKSPQPLCAAVLLGLLAGVLAATFGGWLVLEVVKNSTSACAIAGGILAIPGVAVRVGAPAAAFGGALGVFISGLRARRRLRRPSMVLSLLVALGLGGWGSARVAPRLLIRPEVRRVAHLSEPELGELLERPWFGRNVYILAAIASNPRASPQTLALIAERPEPKLHLEPGNSLLDVLVTPSRELDDSVMLLLARNPGTPAESLERLASSPDGYVLAAVARNPKLSAGTLERLSDSSVTRVRCGVARNPSAGPDVLDRLSRAPDSGIRLAVAQNPATPGDVRQRLHSDKDPFVRDAALRAIRADAVNSPLLVR